ncbi:MAG: hypothetical protein QM811_18890 [Pirellulales bacterium]
MKTVIPEVGPLLAFGMISGSSLEGYIYDWNENLRHDPTKPLSLLSRVGGDPLAAFVGRGQVRPQDYDMFVKWVKVGYGYFEDYVLPQIPAAEADKVRKVLDRVLPLWGKLDGVMRDLLLPALKDGQSGFVLDAKIGSKQSDRATAAVERRVADVRMGHLGRRQRRDQDEASVRRNEGDRRRSGRDRQRKRRRRRAGRFQTAESADPQVGRRRRVVV